MITMIPATCSPPAVSWRQSHVLKDRCCCNPRPQPQFLTACSESHHTTARACETASPLDCTPCSNLPTVSTGPTRINGVLSSATGIGTMTTRRSQSHKVSPFVRSASPSRLTFHTTGYADNRAKLPVLSCRSLHTRHARPLLLSSPPPPLVCTALVPIVERPYR